MVRLLPGIAVKLAERLWEQLSGFPDDDRNEFEAWLAHGKEWRQSLKKYGSSSVITLDELLRTGSRCAGAMIHSILEAIYDDYLQSKYANYEQRRDDLLTLENFLRANHSKIRSEFLSQLSLMATGSSETDCGRGG